MIKLIMFDIDRTLRDENKGIPFSTQYAIKECQKNGIQVGICTGRTLSMVYDDVLSLNFDILITGDGSQIIYHDDILQELYLSKTLIKDIFNSLNMNDIGIAFETKDKVYMNQSASNILKQANIDKGIQSLEKEKIMYANTIQEFNYQIPVSKVCIWSKNKVPKINDVQYIQCIEKQTCYYEFVHLSAGKGKAMKIIKDHLHYQKENIMCFGDGINDISMFNECGYAVAMEDSVEELIKVSNSVCPSTVHDGIYKELVKKNIIKGEI